ncbi:MAG: hypothetical protein OHK0017_05180 [Patescibacteria group bacterium]
MFIGSTIGNVADRHRVLKNIYDSMGHNDLLLIDNGLDTLEWRSFFGSVRDPLVQPWLNWLPTSLGFHAEIFDFMDKYDGETGRRLHSMKLKKDIEMEFKLKNGIKTLNFKEGEEIIIWSHFSHRLNEFIDELRKVRLDVTHLSCVDDRSHILALCEPVLY